VLTAGSALSAPWAAAHVAAVVYAFYPGEAGGAALADVLFGDASPAGRLPVTVYRAEDDLPAFTDYSMKGRTYRYLDKPPLWRFGDGLSYATFAYSNLVVAPEFDSTRDLALAVDVENTSARAADEVVQVYLSQAAAPAYAPRRWLAAFTRVTLAPHERRAVHLTVRSPQLTLVDEAGARVPLAGTVAFAVGGRQPDAAWRYATAADGLTGSVRSRP
jgi:beta-glucosidase